jgi:nucleotide sugar dehydrogenase
MSKLKIAIIGYGFVGKACAHIFRNSNPIIIDPLVGTSVADIGPELDVAMVCVPTPMGENGIINASIVENVLEELKIFPNTLIVLKSTMLPTMVAKFAEQNKNFIYNPEFLTERNALNDAENPFMTVLGGESYAVDVMEQIYKDYSTCSPAPFHKMSAAEASATKYGINTFLATKVLFWNQFYDMCQRENIEYDVVINAITTDSRIGASHTIVPGLDGKRGFSGSCFPKDVTAFVMNNPGMTILKDVWNANCDYRNATPLLDREMAQNVKFNTIA